MRQPLRVSTWAELSRPVDVHDDCAAECQIVLNVGHSVAILVDRELQDHCWDERTLAPHEDLACVAGLQLSRMQWLRWKRSGTQVRGRGL